jgi:hypothetical protein
MCNAPEIYHLSQQPNICVAVVIVQIGCTIRWYKSIFRDKIPLFISKQNSFYFEKIIVLNKLPVCIDFNIEMEYRNNKSENGV